MSTCLSQDSTSDALLAFIRKCRDWQPIQTCNMRSKSYPHLDHSSRSWKTGCNMQNNGKLPEIYTRQSQNLLLCWTRVTATLWIGKCVFYLNMPIRRDQTQLLFYVGKIEVNIYCLIDGCVTFIFYKNAVSRNFGSLEHIILAWEYGPHLFQHPLLWDKDPSSGRRNNIILQGNRTFLSTTLRSSIPLAGRADTVPDREAIAMEQRGLTSHLAQILVSPTPTTPPVKVIVASTSWGKVQLLFTLNPFLDTCSPNREISHKNAFSRPQ